MIPVKTWMNMSYSYTFLKKVLPAVFSAKLKVVSRNRPYLPVNIIR